MHFGERVEDVWASSRLPVNAAVLNQIVVLARSSDTGKCCWEYAGYPLVSRRRGPRPPSRLNISSWCIGGYPS